MLSDIVGPQGPVFSAVPTEIADLVDDQVGRMRTLAKEPGRDNVDDGGADLVAMSEASPCTSTSTLCRQLSERVNSAPPSRNRMENSGPGRLCSVMTFQLETSRLYEWCWEWLP